jgi:predicted RNA-binding Zn-ribbon protein involved in translation (DUF1610 family)
MSGTPGYWQVKVKCLSCGLHFILCTWQPERHTLASLWCPECGEHKRRFVIWLEELDGFIYQAVPGDASLINIGLESRE